MPVNQPSLEELSQVQTVRDPITGKLVTDTSQFKPVDKEKKPVKPETTDKEGK